MLLCGQIEHTKDGWKTEEADGPGDPIGPTYSAFRVAAGAQLAREFPGADVVASGASFLPGSPSVACVVQSELEQLGVGRSRILLLEDTRKTYQELKELAVLMERGYDEAIIVSNEWHLPRVKAMLKHVPVPRVRLLSAEEVLLTHDAEAWRGRIGRMRADPRIAERIALEKKGVEDLEAGRYHFR